MATQHHPTRFRSGTHSKEIAMLRLTTRSLLASAAVLLAVTGCSFDDIDRPAGMLPATDAVASPDAGHEVHRMFEAEKGNATMAELPAQF
jgi:hypothetical protein